MISFSVGIIEIHNRCNIQKINKINLAQVDENE